MIHQSQSLEWKDGFNSVYPLPATSITSILTLCQKLWESAIISWLFSACLALFKSSLICPFQLYSLTELALIRSSLDFFFPLASGIVPALKAWGIGPIGGWFDNYMLHTVSEKDSLTNHCFSSLANTLVSLFKNPMTHLLICIVSSNLLKWGI